MLSKCSTPETCFLQKIYLVKIFQNACKFVLQCKTWGFSTVPGFCRTVCILRRTWMVYCLQLLLLLTTRSSARTLSPCTCWPRCAVRWRWSSRSRRRWTSWTACSPECSLAPRGPSSSTSSHRGPWRRAWEKYTIHPLEKCWLLVERKVRVPHLPQ